MNIQVPVSNIAAMVISLIVSIGLPIGLAVYMKVKGKASFKSWFLGLATFVIAAMTLEPICHTAVIALTGTLFTENLIAYAVYGGLAAGVFEETGRLFTMKVLMKKNLNKKEAVMYGVGHGGMESILIIGTGYITNLVLSMQINQGNMESLLSVAEGDARVELEQSLMQLVELPAWQFLMAGMERVSAIVLHLCLSYIVYRAVKAHNLKWYGLAILLHALVNALTVLAASVLSRFLVEVLLMAAVAGIAMQVYRYYQNEAVSEIGSGS